MAGVKLSAAIVGPLRTKSAGQVLQGVHAGRQEF